MLKERPILHASRDLIATVTNPIPEAAFFTSGFTAESHVQLISNMADMTTSRNLTCSCIFT